MDAATARPDVHRARFTAGRQAAADGDRRRLLLGLTVLAAGCARFGAKSESPPAAHETAAAVAAREAAQAAITRWRLVGRIGVQRDDQGFNGAIQWRQDGPSFDIRITAPLNGGTFLLAGDGAGVVLVDPKGALYRAPTAEALMAEHLGWTIPVGGVAWWIRGLTAPAPAAAQLRRDDAGRLTDFAQDGWRVSVLRYGSGRTPVLPEKLFLSRDTLKLRLVIKQWEVS
ncbi:MAG: lipoprotein insertase outer membrane protein LolB [Gammaproteobacteria bacterium]